MPDEAAADANSAAHSTSPAHVSTRNSVTEYAASSTIFTRASQACTGEVPPQYVFTVKRMRCSMP